MNCDCMPGKFLCKQAMYLWSEVNRLYQSGYYPGDIEYDNATKAYQEHVNSVSSKHENDVVYQYAMREG